jgi:hypothetical protein
MPGPGAYNPRLIQTAHCFSVGSSNRANLVVNDNPGPGFYGNTESTLGGPKVILIIMVKKIKMVFFSALHCRKIRK